MDEDQLGAFLRKDGLHSNNLVDWKAEPLSQAAKRKVPGRPRKDPELVAAEEEIKKLKRDLRRKEKALAEQTALVILKKKPRKSGGEGRTRKTNRAG